MAAVFAQLITPDGEGHGVHCLVVPIRDDEGNDLPGVTTSDCHYKGGLPGVDNGRIQFDHVRVPRENLLNKYADVAEDGTYPSPIENPNRRFFTMLGTLIRGRVTVGGSAGAAARVALDIATRYALQRRQFAAPGDENEVLLMDYLVHQRRLFPLIAKSYALQFAQNELVAKCHELQTADDPDAEDQRELESRAAGLKAANTWHATRAIQEAREACGGAGYLAENRLIALKADTDVFTTFEGDNHVLTQLVAKELLTAYADDIKGMSPVDWVRFAANFAGERVLKRTAAETIMQTILDTRQDNEEEGSLFNRGTQVKMFEDREEYMIATVARRLQGKSKEMSAFDAFNSVQDHVLHAARVHIERIILEAFVAGIEACEDEEARKILNMVCDLYALSVMEEDRAWFMEHRFLSTERAKAVTRGINERCRNLRPVRRVAGGRVRNTRSNCATPRCCTRRTFPTPMSKSRRTPPARARSSRSSTGFGTCSSTVSWPSRAGRAGGNDAGPSSRLRSVQLTNAPTAVERAIGRASQASRSGSKASAMFWAMEVKCAMAAATALPSKSEGRVIIMR